MFGQFSVLQIPNFGLIMLLAAEYTEVATEVLGLISWIFPGSVSA